MVRIQTIVNDRKRRISMYLLFIISSIYHVSKGTNKNVYFI